MLSFRGKWSAEYIRRTSTRNNYFREKQLSISASMTTDNFIRWGRCAATSGSAPPYSLPTAVRNILVFSSDRFLGCEKHFSGSPIVISARTPTDPRTEINQPLILFGKARFGHSAVFLFPFVVIFLSKNAFDLVQFLILRNSISRSGRKFQPAALAQMGRRREAHYPRANSRPDF